MGGSDTKQETQTQQTTQLPPWVSDAAQQNYAYAQNVAQRPLQQYQGQQVADVAPQTQQAWNTAATGATAGQPQYDAATAGYLGTLGQSPQQVTAGQLSSTNLQPYMSPYTQDVIDKTMPIYQQQLGQQQIGNQSQAAGAGAYGGSRQAIQQGVTQAQGAQGMAQMAAQLNQQNFTQAQAAAQQDITGRYNADVANQGAQQNQGALNNAASAGLANLGNQAQLSQARNFTEQMTAGASQQAQAQAQIDANKASFNQAWQYPYQQLGVLQSSLGMTPYGTATQGQSNTETQQAANPAGMILGGLSSLGDLFGAGGMFGAGGALGGQSDRSMKTDITKVGKHPTGIGIYSYRYKGDPKTYPKVVGPMAEDVAKIAPGAVATIPGSGGKQMVHMPTLNALSPPRAGAPMPPAIGGMAPAPALRPTLPRKPSLTAIAGTGPTGPAVPGALAGASPFGPVGALGGTMRAPRGISGSRAIRPRPPQIRGALGG